MTERRADDATREVADWLKCEYMQDHVGAEFSGVISSVTGFGLFVRLDDLFIDGLVHISTLDNDYYQFDAAKQRLIGENSGMIYRLGDKVKIRVVAVHLEQKMVDFSLVESARNHLDEENSKTKSEKVFKELPPKASKKRKSAVKNKDVSKEPTRKRKK